MLRKLDFGSGYNPRKGYMTCDMTNSPFLDFCYDSDLNFLSCDNDYFDKINIKNVFHHIKNLEECVMELYRVLKTGGLIVLTDVCREKYLSNYNLDYLWYRIINVNYDIWFSSKYRNYFKIMEAFFKIKRRFKFKEKEISIWIK
jgi:ubiquinone/menaquinone biosynthesis C-methylase UbiE